MNKTELLNKIATLLGGRASEGLVFGDISTGAHNDLAKATEIARSMVKEYGMSEKVGQVYFARQKRPPMFEWGFREEEEYSQTTAELIDSEVTRIITEQYARASELLKGKLSILDKAAKVLLKKEKIDGDELKAILEEEEAPENQAEP